MGKQRYAWWLWGIWTLVGIALLAALAYDEGMTGEMTTLGWLALMLSTAPLVGAQLALGSPRAAKQIQTWLQRSKHPLWIVTAFITVLYLFGNVLAGGFDPYAFTIFVIGLLAALGALREVGNGKRGLTWTDIAIWLLLWIPFDLRWNYDLWQGAHGMRYNWWAVAVTVVGVLGWYAFREMPDFGYDLIPRGRDILLAVVLTAIFAAIIVPIGLAIDFIQFPPSETPTVLSVVAAFIGLFLTVALPEELFFRGILLHGLDQMMERRWLALLISSVAFGLMHWNNASDLGTQIAYVTLASVAGAFYGTAYRRSGNKLFAAALTHTFVDLIWRFLFS